MPKKPELLVPLNDWKSLSPQTKILDNGDAFYFGLKQKFSMRARAGNFSIDELPKLSKKIHSHDKKAYLCTNIVIYNDEINELAEIIQHAKNSGIDAIICHDLAAITIAKEIGIPFHISTQANVSNLRSAIFYESLGAERIILARELHLEQIKQIIKDVHIPIEAFIHGAMCTAISGRCYFSAELVNYDQEFSANRGKCAQPCRRNYTFDGEEGEKIDYEPISGMFFNTKDLCMIEHIDKLIEANIASFKIEGRIRDPLYISETSSCYREIIDSYFEGNYSQEIIDICLERLKRVYNRGFHTGFYFSVPNSDNIERNIRGNVSKWKKHLIGKVINYYRKSSAVEIEIYTGQIEIGQDIIFENEADFYHKQKLKSIKINNILVEKTPIISLKERKIAGIAVDVPIPINSKIFLYKKGNNEKNNVNKS
ncbi:MAG: U32 family peptidase [archaeon]|nr:U32 family peptidase [archaeon]